MDELFARAINGPLCNSLVLNFAYADFEESKHNKDKAEKVYTTLLENKEIDPTLVGFREGRGRQEIERKGEGGRVRENRRWRQEGERRGPSTHTNFFALSQYSPCIDFIISIGLYTVYEFWSSYWRCQTGSNCFQNCQGRQQVWISCLRCSCTPRILYY